MTTGTPKGPQARPSKSQHVECAKCGETLTRVNATGDPGKDFIESRKSIENKSASDAEGKSDVTDPVHQERLDRRRTSAWFLIPKADQEIRSETDTLPAKEHLQKVVC